VPDYRLQRGLRVTFAGMAVNLVLAAVKLIAGVVGHSHALIADAVESIADLISSAVVWSGLVVAAEPPDEDHPYGHGKAEPMAAAMVSMMLLLAAGWIAVTAFLEIHQPRLAPARFTLIVLFVVVVVKEAMFRYVSRAGKELDSAAVRTDAWHHRSDAITSIGAAIGITIALVTGYWDADNWAAIAAALVIAWNGWSLLRPALAELMDTAPNREIVQHVRSIAAGVPGVDRVEKCIVRKMGYHYYVDMHVEMDPQMTVLRSHEIAHEVKDKVRAEILSVRDVLVHIEPRSH
jgi:cation diffusion facilitator family transporter